MSTPLSNNPWPTRPWSPTDLTVGPAAWRLPALVQHPGHVLARPSLIVIEESDDDATLRAAAPLLADRADLPILLAMDGPPSARRVSAMIRARLDVLQRSVMDAVVIRPEEATDLKGGAVLQSLFALRSEGVVRWIGVGHRDAREAEWLVLSVAARIVMLEYGLTNQAARYRATGEAAEYGFACLGMTPPADDDEGLRFALGESMRVLPVLDQPMPDGVSPMTGEEVERCWGEYQATHAPPAPLERRRPPE